MIISCPTCGHNFDIPDEKVPDNHRFVVKCPSCREKIIAKGNPDKGGVNNGSAESYEPDKKKTIEPDIFPPGSQVVFSYIQSRAWNRAIESFFTDKGYYLSKATEVDEAILKLRLNQYHVVIIDDRYSAKMILKEIGSWPGLKRRWVDVVLIGDKVESMNPQEAFFRGVNSYLNINDVNKAAELFDEVLREYEIHNEPWGLVSETES